MNLTAEPSARLNGRELIMNTLNGLSVGIIVALVPGALLNQLLKALLPVFPQAAFFLTLTGKAAVLMAPISAVCVGMMAGFGFAGLIGPIAAVNGYGNANLMNIVLVSLLFFVIPITLGYVSNYLFNSKLSYFDAQDFELDYS